MQWPAAVASFSGQLTGLGGLCGALLLCSLYLQLAVCHHQE